MYSKPFVLLAFLFFAFASLYAQNDDTSERLEEGKPCPDITLTDIHYYPKKELHLSELRGKWVVLDFWNRQCMGCIRSFPETNEMQKQLAPKVQFFLVGLKDGDLTSALYERFQKRLNLELPVVYDTVLFKRFDIGPCPYMIIIDDKGVVQSIAAAITPAELTELMEGRRPPIVPGMNNRQFEQQWNSFDMWKPLFTYGNGGPDTDFVYRSLIGQWNTRQPYKYVEHLNYHFQNKVQVMGIILRKLYTLAYGDTISKYPFQKINAYGSSWYEPILELQDSSDFNYDDATGRGIFNYSLIVPKEKATVPYLQACMQKDLQVYFGYQVTVRWQRMPYYRLVVVSKKARKALQTKGGPIAYQTTPFQFTFKNQPLHMLINKLFAEFQSGPPFIDGTRITGNVDVNMYCNFRDLEEVRSALGENGLRLVKRYKKMKVILIRPPLKARGQEVAIRSAGGK